MSRARLATVAETSDPKGLADRARVRVVIADDHPVLRGVIRLACDAAPGLDVVGEAGSNEEALQVCWAVDPDVLVLDLATRSAISLDVARRLKAEGSRARVLVLAEHTDDQTLFACIRARVDGYLGHTAGLRNITSAIESVGTGGRVFTLDEERRALAQLGRITRRVREASSLSAELTAREMDILRLLSHGLTMRQVASRLRVSPRTVESHIARLYRKLGVRTRLHAITRAATLGLIDLGSSDYEPSVGELT